MVFYGDLDLWEVTYKLTADAKLPLYKITVQATNYEEAILLAHRNYRNTLHHHQECNSVTAVRLLPPPPPPSEMTCDGCGRPPSHECRVHFVADIKRLTEERDAWRRAAEQQKQKVTTAGPAGGEIDVESFLAYVVGLAARVGRADLATAKPPESGDSSPTSAECRASSRSKQR